ncbi:hexosaminidase D-like isoform X3 [Ornithodoros turicata]|uniref:hexosaminidase D-like isoform X3 n=1 Tax=Ornithodoros turicata TaxID=34597 RepID=UPI00313968F3
MVNRTSSSYYSAENVVLCVRDAMFATGRLCVHQVILAMWRRKPLLVLAVLTVLAIFVFLQYSPVRVTSAHHMRDEPGPAVAPIGMVGQPERVSEERRPVAGSVYDAASRKRVYIPEQRYVHLDLKGAPPKVSYMKQVFPLLHEAGANGLLLEYEDMFPYEGTLAPVRAKNAYTKEELAEILEAARQNELEVIPLVQTFGHMEFVLKLPEFRHNRETDEHPTALCPSRNDSFTLVTAMVDQVLSLHPHVRWLHIGCDEVFHLGYCSRCQQRDREELFLSHVTRVARYVREKHNRIPIIWDDMLRQISTDKLRQYSVGTLVEPMVWTYVKDVYRFVSYSNWATYGEIFDSVWAASAFKGAFGETLTVPNAKMHLENNEGWLEVMSEQHGKFKNFRGIVVTGWQRYDHFASLCELFPSGLPSLILDLLVLTNGAYTNALPTRFHSMLKCTHSRTQMDLEGDPFLWQKGYGCFFPGSAVFRMTQTHSEAIKKARDYLMDVTVSKAWLTDYNIRRNMSLPSRVDQGLEEFSSTMFALTSLVHQARDVLREVFDEYTVAEWIEQNIYPSILRLDKLQNDALALKKPRTWPVRPLEPLPDLKRFNVGSLGN